MSWFKEYTKLKTYEHLVIGMLLMNVITMTAWAFAMPLIYAVWLGGLSIALAFYGRELSNYQCQHFNEHEKFQKIGPALNPFNWLAHDKAQTFILWLAITVEIVWLNIS